MTRHAYEAAKCQETKDVEIILVPEDTHQTWQHISQSVHHPHHHHHHHPHHYPPHQAAQGEGEQQQVSHNSEHNSQAHLTPEQVRAKASAMAEQQQWDQTAKSVTSGFQSVYNSAANPMRDGVNAVRNGWDGFMDNCTLSTSWIGGDNMRKHAQELELQAKTENKLGNYQLADKLLNRDLQFSVSAFGLTDKLTIQLSKELQALHKQHNDLPHLDMLNER
jgi:hypothetical protein